MKQSLLSLTVALAAVFGFGATAAAQTSVYATGNFTGIPASWDPENPVELTYADGVYTLDLTGAKQGQMFKLSTAKGDWTTFNASCFGVAADNTTVTLTPNVATTWAVGNLGNNAIPASGDFKLVVDLDAKTMTLSAREQPRTSSIYTCAAMSIAGMQTRLTSLNIPASALSANRCTS